MAPQTCKVFSYSLFHLILTADLILQKTVESLGKVICLTTAFM